MSLFGKFFGKKQPSEQPNGQALDMLRALLLEDLENWEDLPAAKAEDTGEPSLSLEAVKRELGLL